MSPRKQQKFVHNAGPVEVERTASLQLLSDATAEQGYTLYPSTLKQLTTDLNRAESWNTILGLEEYQRCGAALIAAAIHQARSAGTRILRVHDLKAGWQDGLCTAKGCALHHCARASILDRWSEVIAHFPEAQTLLDHS